LLKKRLSALILAPALILVGLAAPGLGGPQERLALKKPRVPAKVAIEDPPLFPLKKVKAGQRGRGYTVFSSRLGPEPFDFEVLGVMNNYLGPGAHLIIARLIGKKIEKTGVISGMSGSPVYIDGKLVGAVGYRFGAFTDEAIAGITPIELMLDSFAKTTKKKRVAQGPGTFPETTWGRATPISVPITTQGMQPQVLKAFEPIFAERGYGPLMPGAGGGRVGAGLSPPERFYAGGPITGVLVDGDINMAGLGTVTWVRGNQFLAFGHPFMGVGESTMVVKNAEVITTVSSDSGSWKMGQPTATVGSLTDDRLFAIAGTMGKRGHAIPMSLTLDPKGSGGDSAQERLSFSLSPHDKDLPLFAAITVATALSNRTDRELGGTWSVAGKVGLSGKGQAQFARTLVDERRGLEVPAAMVVLEELGDLVDQPFGTLEIESIDVVIGRDRDLRFDRLVGLASPAPVRAGEKIPLKLRVSPWRKDPAFESVTIRIPAGLPAGKYDLLVADSYDAWITERRYGLIPQAWDLSTWLENRKMRPSDQTLNVYVILDQEGPMFDGLAMPGLPTSLQELLPPGKGMSGGDVDGHAIKVKTVKRPAHFFGSMKTKLIIQD
jgi:hypothetical protein